MRSLHGVKSVYLLVCVCLLVGPINTHIEEASRPGSWTFRDSDLKTAQQDWTMSKNDHLFLKEEKSFIYKELHWNLYCFQTDCSILCNFPSKKIQKQ